MTPTDTLRAEHQNILRALAVLDLVSLRIERSAEPDATAIEAAKDLLFFFRDYADRLHHEKEERILFPALLRNGMPPQGGPVQVMLADHVACRSLLGEMGQALDAGLRDHQARGRFTGASNRYIEVLRSHIMKEDHVLWPMSERLLRAEEMAGVQERFTAADGPEQAAFRRHTTKLDALEAAWKLGRA